MKPSLIAIAGWAHPAESLEPLADLLRDVCDVQTISAADFDPHAPLRSPVLLLGWSLGGLLALEAAAAQPDAVQGLILINSTARFTVSHDWPHGLPAGELRALGRALRHDVATALHGFFTLCAYHHPLLPTAPLPLPALHKGLRHLAETDLRPLLARVSGPVLVLHAREDAVIPIGAGQALAAGLPRARLVVCEGIGHDLPVRAPGRVAAPVREFIHASFPAS